MSESFQSAYQEEESRLNEVIVEIDRQLERLRGIPVYTGHDFTEQVLEAGREEKRQALAKVCRSLTSGGWIFRRAERERRNRSTSGRSASIRKMPGITRW